MIDLEALVRGINEGFAAASDIAISRHLELLDVFFEKEGDGAEISHLAQALRAGGEVSGDPPSGIPSGGAENPSKRAVLTPRNVIVEFPKVDKDGPASHQVHVPLITLVPLSLPQISKMKLTTDLEIRLAEDRLLASFPGKREQDQGDDLVESREPPVGLATLEMEFDSPKAPDGLEKLIEGYEKALRAQIPG